MANSGRLRGLVGQRMSVKAPKTQTIGAALKITGSGTITAPAYPTMAEAWAIGAGGGGYSGVTYAGGGAGACYRRFRCSPGVVMAFSVGAGGTNGNPGTDGGATTLTLPNGTVISALGGLAAQVAAPGAGGFATNGDINRRGGAGGTSSAGSAGEFGGAGGAIGPSSGGGGSAGFSDTGYPTGGAGGAGNSAGIAPGGGGGVTANGADGQLFVTFVRQTGA